ncbi:VOC family protein [Flaviaesturariibacter aridisoli]|uniref:VOC family protein n=1 Tax=Flaviaesturariibacter aridisoli TaxID=2545761 RepID=A0A4V2WMQ6_9BACT|nr:VOC family protein [Flaviaesturariibacter aridisoli]TCZ72157.1 VOC family protein [Flaviaesturariibacter aridisoli]
MTFAYTILYVPAVEAALAFYEKAFGCTRRFIAPDSSYGELDTGGTTLSFASLALAASNLEGGFQAPDASGRPFGFEIGFATTDVAAAVDAALRAGATLAAPVKTKPWGQVVAYVRDPNGFLVELCTPMG